MYFRVYLPCRTNYTSDLGPIPTVFVVSFFEHFVISRKTKMIFVQQINKKHFFATLQLLHKDNAHDVRDNVAFNTLMVIDDITLCLAIRVR